MSVQKPDGGHAKITYTWSKDGKTCTAVRQGECGDNIANAKISEKIEQAPTCLQMGSTTYSAEFTEKWAKNGQTNENRTKNIQDIPSDPEAHVWNAPTYTWSIKEAADESHCTAERVCADDPAHREFESVLLTTKIVEEPTFEEKGKLVYSAEFTKEWTAKETNIEKEIPVLQPIRLPPTGDDSNILLWLMLLLISGGVGLRLLLKSKKK